MRIKVINKERLEIILLCILVFVLPTMESPKTIAALLFMAMWIMNRFTGLRKIQLRRPDLMETCVLFLIFTAAMSTAVNWPFQNGLKGLKDTLFYSGVFLCIYNSNYSDRQKYAIAVFAVLGVLIGLVWGIIEIGEGKRSLLELHSVGIVTQSAIYVGMTVILAFSVLISGAARQKHFAFWISALGVMAVGLFFMASRGAIVATAVAFIVLCFSFKAKKVLFVVIPLIGALLFLMSYSPDWFDQKRLVGKINQYAAKQELPESDKERISMWRIGIARFMQGDSMLFGIGPRNFSSIDVSKLNLEGLYLLDKRLKHAHNIFLTQLVEEGITGLCALVLFFAVIASIIVKDYREQNWRNWAWSSAVGALLVPIIGGSFNTPWKQEHALLSMILLGMYLSSRKAAAADVQKIGEKG
jgi:O-antigen ligase